MYFQVCKEDDIKKLDYIVLGEIMLREPVGSSRNHVLGFKVNSKTPSSAFI